MAGQGRWRDYSAAPRPRAPSMPPEPLPAQHRQRQVWDRRRAHPPKADADKVRREWQARPAPRCGGCCRAFQEARAVRAGVRAGAVSASRASSRSSATTRTWPAWSPSPSEPSNASTIHDAGLPLRQYSRSSRQQGGPRPDSKFPLTPALSRAISPWRDCHSESPHPQADAVSFDCELAKASSTGRRTG